MISSKTPRKMSVKRLFWCSSSYVPFNMWFQGSFEEISLYQTQKQCWNMFSWFISMIFIVIWYCCNISIVSTNCHRSDGSIDLSYMSNYHGMNEIYIMNKQSLNQMNSLSIIQSLQLDHTTPTNTELRRFVWLSDQTNTRVCLSVTKLPLDSRCLRTFRKDSFAM